MAILTFANVRKAFQNGDVKEDVLKGIALSLQEGDVTALVGASGSGKSTLLTIAAGLQSASAGRVLFDGRDLSAMTQEQVRAVRAREFGFVFQTAHLVPFLTVEEQLLLMLDVAESPLSPAARKREVQALLEAVGMAHRRRAYPASLSGGEKQRVAIARALVHNPRLLFADEPTASLDSKRSHEVMALVRDLVKTRQITAFLVTHDEEMLAYADRVVSMRDGSIVAPSSS